MESFTCQQVTDAIIDYLTGEMHPETTIVFNHHLRDCPDCRAFFHTYQGTIRATRSLSYNEVPGEVRDRVRQFLLKSIISR